MKKCDVAAYIWPAYTGDEKRTRIFWEEGIGEWQTVKNTNIKIGDYTWNRKPVWGYQNEADPYVMSMQIDAALDHGVNVFIYDWYWYDNRPFLENCLNDGFLKAPNCNKMKFYIMWANHSAGYTWDKRISDYIFEDVWKGEVNREQFETIGRRWIEKYFKKENYYKIDGKPIVSIYELSTFVKGLGGVDKAAEALNWLQNEAKKEGFPGVHFQYIRMGDRPVNVTGVDGANVPMTKDEIESMGFDSLTHYQFVHCTDMNRDYMEVLADIEKEWEKASTNFNMKYFPHVSIGWDNNPRSTRMRSPVVYNNTPENFEIALRKAKALADKIDAPMITINSWNEWTETSYLLPDNLYGYGYLEACKRVFLEE